VPPVPRRGPHLHLRHLDKLEEVRCIFVDGSGCYGRNGHEDAAADSAMLAKAVGKPVRVQWSRADLWVAQGSAGSDMSPRRLWNSPANSPGKKASQVSLS
jgi:hypothetical protein